MSDSAELAAQLSHVFITSPTTGRATTRGIRRDGFDSRVGHMEKYNCLYGTREAWAYPENHLGNHVAYGYFYVSLKKDPGFGSMNFSCIARSQITFIDEPPPVPEKWWETHNE